MPDDNRLALATAEARILVTFNLAAFPRIVRRWAEEGHAHADCAIVVGIDHSEFGTTIRVIERVLDARPAHKDWHDYTCFVARGD